MTWQTPVGLMMSAPPSRLTWQRHLWCSRCQKQYNVCSVKKFRCSWIICAYCGLKFLSVQAFNLYLDATKSAKSTTISFKEYLRLRSILLWACFKACPQAEAVLQASLPDEVCLVQKGGFKDLRTGHRHSSPGIVLLILESLREHVASLNSGWSSFQLQCIHPQILVKVLEPLEIIPPPLFLEALKYQVLHRRDLSTMRWHNSNRDLGVKVRESGLLLHVEKTALGSPVHVRGTMPINHGMCEWDIVIKAPCGLLFIGIYEPRHRTSSKCALLDQKQWSRYLSTHGRLCVGDVAGEVYCKSFGQTADSKVRVHVDMKQRTCAFTVDGHRSGVAWSDVPQEVYPVVVPTKPCKIRIRLVSSADYM